MSINPLNDLELWVAIRNNDEIAFGELFDRHWAGLYKLAFSYLKDQETSKEIVHDVFLNIWNRRAELQIQSFNSFLLTAVRYQIYNRMRSAKLTVVYTADYSKTDHVFELNSGDARIKQQELQNELNEYLVQLPKRCTKIFQMSRIEQMSNQEIAERLGISKRTVENQISLAVKHLKGCYKNLTFLILLIVGNT